MSSPIHDKKRQLQYLSQRVQLIQEMLRYMEDAEDEESIDLNQIDRMFKEVRIKVNQFKEGYSEG